MTVWHVLPVLLLAAPAVLAQKAPTPAADAQTAAIVVEAEGFLATLSDEERGAVLFAWEDDAQRTNWSNFPTGIFQRAGLRWGDLDDARHGIRRERLRG